MSAYGRSGMLKRKQKSKMKKGDAINVINSTAQQLYLVSRYEQHTYQRWAMYVCTKREAKEGKKERKNRDKRRMGGGSRAQPAVCTFERLFVRYVSYHRTLSHGLYCMVWLLTSPTMVKSYENFRLDGINDHDRLTSWHEWGWIWGFGQSSDQ